ncbi:MAG: riboflavin biosynthesis protein RibF [Ignavibacteriae bacterium]|nr:riboflavin biosynthesis protein RibF [Ignavibacteriota bacterium]
MNIYSSDNIIFDGNTILTVGTFDGVHRGHQEIIKRLIESAKELNGRAVIVTFEPHPQIVLQKPDREPIHLLSSIEERLELFEKFGIETVVIIPFSQEFSQISSENFVRDFLCKKIGVKKILIGYDHLFGKDRTGNETLLRTLGDELGFEVERTDALSVGDETISSTKIRHALAEARLEDANNALGYPYFVQGIVVEGHRRGHTLGIPTANVKPRNPHKLLPANGVYLVSSDIDGKMYYGMANIGLRPTFTNDVIPTLEVHYLFMDMNLYDRMISVNFLKYIRGERKFDSVDLFLSQVVEDRNICLEWIEGMGKE